MSLSPRAAVEALGTTAASVLVHTIRGGGVAASAASPLLDFTKEADAYFGNIRTPASLILGASLGALFTNANTTSQPQMTALERTYTRFYNTCVFCSYLLSFTTLVFSTAVGVTLLHQDFDPKAVSAYQLLMREFEFEFITVRLSYLLSLVTFVSGITARILVEYKLLVPERRDEARVVCFGVTATMTHLWSYINSTLAPSDQTMWSLAWRWVQLVLTRTIEQHRPVQMLSLISAALTVFFYSRVLQKTKRKRDDAIL